MSSVHTITIANRDGATFEVEAKRPLLDSLREQGVDLLWLPPVMQEDFVPVSM